MHDMLPVLFFQWIPHLFGIVLGMLAGSESKWCIVFCPVSAFVSIGDGLRVPVLYLLTSAPYISKLVSFVSFVLSSLFVLGAGRLSCHRASSLPLPWVAGAFLPAVPFSWVASLTVSEVLVPSYLLPQNSCP